MSELSRDNQGVLSSDRVSFESVGDLFVVGWICCEQKEAACRLIKPVVHTDISYAWSTAAHKGLYRLGPVDWVYQRLC